MAEGKTSPATPPRPREGMPYGQGHREYRRSIAHTALETPLDPSKHPEVPPPSQEMRSGFAPSASQIPLGKIFLIVYPVMRAVRQGEAVILGILGMQLQADMSAGRADHIIGIPARTEKGLVLRR